MSLTKNRIVKDIQKSVHLPRSQSIKFIETTLEIIKGALESDEEVLISGFGKFSRKDNNKRRGGNPISGNAYIPDAKKVVTFKCSPVLMKKINGNKN